MEQHKQKNAPFFHVFIIVFSIEIAVDIVEVRGSSPPTPTSKEALEMQRF
ncbi:MAG: hypothetical protein J1E43_08865 [Christensenellaceae bacterium]|nr:hypothetical protein [Christensenellaceae bacterium]